MLRYYSPINCDDCPADRYIIVASVIKRSHADGAELPVIATIFCDLKLNSRVVAQALRLVVYVESGRSI